ncbi:YbaB/EbfC family nucleoid-associated protein [Labedaea rhizosphaerae]|uniref:DNA-binding protein YbaB n=1 Tax=Labedaea rhizosphaerae TaxID=598644 RepID=A0A4R6SAA5_LABRH|nr:YbaB/EbfC family nucleoid-associated protein [Labedaea rhizosphaerae]TDP96751.1 DNA-binding protein YbaB [Labedaea rhizosphaerae]
MTDMSESLQTEEELRLEDRAAQQRIERFAAAADKIDNTEVTESSPRGEVRVTVRTSGAVRAIELGPSGVRLSATEIVSLVLGCVQRAQTRIAEVAQRILAAEVGDDPAADLVLSDYRNRFPAVAEPSAPRAKPAGAGDDWAERPVLRTTSWAADGSGA